MAGDEGRVKDLRKKLDRGEITKKEAIQELLSRGLGHDRPQKPWINVIAILSLFGWWFLCFISGIAKAANIFSLEFLVRLPAISFPLLVRYSAIAFTFVGIILMVLPTRLRVKKGGATVPHPSETVVLVKDGIYGIMRHPGAFGLFAILFSITVIVSGFVPFNILSVAGNILLFAGIYYVSVDEEKLSILKWGDEYRQYMKEVPRFNFILGLWGPRRGR